MANLQQYQQDFVLFLEAGFIAVNQMDELSALSLFQASRMLSPNNVLPAIGIGYLHLCKMELKQAARAFEEVLSYDPSNQMAKTFLGLVLALNPSEMTKGEKILHETAGQNEDMAVKKLSSDAIEFVDVYLKKAPSPLTTMQTKPPKKDKKK